MVQGAGQVRVWDRSGMRGKPGAHCGLQDLKPREQQRPACVQSISRPLQLSPELVPQPREAPAQAPLRGGCSPNTPTPASVLHVAGPDLRQPTLASQHPCGIRAVAVCTSHKRKLRPGGRGACWGAPTPAPGWAPCSFLEDPGLQNPLCAWEPGGAGSSGCFPGDPQAGPALAPTRLGSPLPARTGVPGRDSGFQPPGA